MQRITAHMALIVTTSAPMWGMAAQSLPDHVAVASFAFCQGAPDAAMRARAEAPAAPGASGVSERDEAAALLIRAGVRIAEAHRNAAECVKVFAEGRQRFDQALARQTPRVRASGRYEPSSVARIAEVQTRITEQWVADQAGRMAYLDLQTTDRTGAAFWAHRLATANAVAVDAASTELMRTLLKEFDWLDSHRFGARVASQAWILVQHADDHPDFQQLALDRMEPHLASGGVRPADYAHLWDRVAVNTGKPQRYGTQPTTTCNPDGTLDLRAVEDPARLDDRRRTMGLGPAADELARKAAERCRRGT
jgi:hypothetical protein